MTSVNLWKQRVLRVTQRNRVSIKGAPATALEDMGSPITEAVKLQLSTLPTVKQVQLKLSRENKLYWGMGTSAGKCTCPATSENRPQTYIGFQLMKVDGAAWDF